LLLEAGSRANAEAQRMLRHSDFFSLANVVTFIHMVTLHPSHKLYHMWAYSEQINTKHRRGIVGMKALPICNRQFAPNALNCRELKIKFEELPKNIPSAREVYVGS
jgi:hypothetical protein